MLTDNPVILFTPYFRARTQERQRELDYCLKQNLACTDIKKVFLLVDDGHTPPVSDEKIEIINIPSRPTYRQWIEISRDAHPSAISILANTDIHFDDSLGKIRDVLAPAKSFLALSRYEKVGEDLVPHPNPHWSQDVWAIHTGSDVSESFLKSLEVPLGVPRCDNKIAYLFAVQGWRICNPFKFLRSIHVHETQQRSYDKKLDLTVVGGVAYVHPGQAPSDPAEIEVDVWAKNADAIQSVKLNKSLDRWAAEAQEGKEAPPAVAPRAESASGAEAQGEPRKSPMFSQPPVSTSERREFITRGQVIFDHLSRFRVYRYNNELLCVDALQMRGSQKVPLALGESVNPPAPDILAAFIPPIVDTYPIVIKDRPSGPKDSHFWQYPCATGRQAWENHLDIPAGRNVDTDRRVINTYLALPWATYIDKQTYPEEIVSYLKPRLMGYRSLAEVNGYELRVHTVCQQIHWRRFVDNFHELGITDLHLSHHEKNIDPQKDGYRFRVHSWPLIAVNVEDRSRSGGIQVGKKVKDKAYFASFIGAHMGHYRSDVRLKLLDAAQADGGSDILVDLGGEWHFNKIVYQEQVQNVAVDMASQEKHDNSTLRYNQILSDSVFSLCPEGAGPNTLRVWESLAVGAIPVILSDEWAPPKVPDSKLEIEDCCVFFAVSEIGGLFEYLRSLPEERLEKMQLACVEIYKHFRNFKAF